ncbi:hypothetical protein ACF07S_05390 [Streptomyces sp. NPDC016640]|uniref:hypothetical protein n=1 Tax=Streptomyces sp. NPDC016640 TaxID=3364969 RepID=UPI0036F5407B
MRVVTVVVTGIGATLYRITRILLVPSAPAVRRRVPGPVVRVLAVAVRVVGRASGQALAAARTPVRRTRADRRRTPFGEPAGEHAGEPAKPRLAPRREPTGRETRTLGSSTTALTKD